MRGARALEKGGSPGEERLWGREASATKKKKGDDFFEGRVSQKKELKSALSHLLVVEKATGWEILFCKGVIH